MPLIHSYACQSKERCQLALVVPSDVVKLPAHAMADGNGRFHYVVVYRSGNVAR